MLSCCLAAVHASLPLLHPRITITIPCAVALHPLPTRPLVKYPRPQPLMHPISRPLSLDTVFGLGHWPPWMIIAVSDERREPAWVGVATTHADFPSWVDTSFDRPFGSLPMRMESWSIGGLEHYPVASSAQIIAFLGATSGPDSRG